MPVVGVISPAGRVSVKDQLGRMLPGQIEIIEDSLRIRTGTQAELEQAIPRYEAIVKAMAERGADLVHPAGAPPLLLGYAGESELVARWERAYGVAIFTNGMSQVNALKAFGARRILGLTYFSAPLNARFARYYDEAGFEVLAMNGLVVDFQAAPAVEAEALYAFIKDQYLGHREADAIYLLGPAWKTLDLIGAMEDEFGVPIVHHVPAQSWEMQRRLGLRETFPGFGRLIGELPELVA